MEFSKDKAIYVQIAERLMDGILSGRFQEGGRLPSVREVAADVEVNVNTVVRSYEWLEQLGVVYQKRGLGFFASGGARDNIITHRREVFFNQKLPLLTAEMRKLSISWDEVIQFCRGLDAGGAKKS